MKKYLKSLLSETQRQALRRRQNKILAFREFVYDSRRFLRYSSATNDPVAKGQLAAHITMDYHRLEKGLALPEPRVGFGKDVVERLVRRVQQYSGWFGHDDLTKTALGVLAVYQEKQKQLGHSNPALDEFVARFDRGAFMAAQECGVMSVGLDALFPFETKTAEDVLLSRHSVRQFTGEVVPNDIIARIALLAQRAPSVCNRQAGRLYCANSREVIDQVLSYQNGNRGFGHLIGAVFIVTADLQAFTTMGERNQGYVDGGIFAMQALAAIHAEKLGGCMLNWSQSSARDKALRAAFGIGESEVVITMIGCGYPVNTPMVAVSPRVSAGDVLRML